MERLWQIVYRPRCFVDHAQLDNMIRGEEKFKTCRKRTHFFPPLPTNAPPGLRPHFRPPYAPYFFPDFLLSFIIIIISFYLFKYFLKPYYYYYFFNIISLLFFAMFCDVLPQTHSWITRYLESVAMVHQCRAIRRLAAPRSVLRGPRTAP